MPNKMATFEKLGLSAWPFTFTNMLKEKNKKWYFMNFGLSAWPFNFMV